jgi:hypothetical protein
MKKTIFVLVAFVAMLFTSCSEVFDNDTVKKSDGISCTIDASSLAHLSGARAASSTFTITITMKNSSSGVELQSKSDTCTAGGSCNFLFDPIAAGTKVVFTGTVAYNGSTIGIISSDEYTITGGTNTITLIIAEAYPVTVAFDLSSYSITDNGTVTLTLKNNSDNTMQTKTVTDALNVAKTVTFDTSVEAGTSVTVSGYVTYNNEEAYDFIDKTFTVSSETGTVSLSGYETQSFTYSYNRCYSGTITYGFQGAKTDVIPADDNISSPYNFTTTVAPDGQIYVLYYYPGTGVSTIYYYLYTNGTTYRVSDISGQPSSALKLCKLSDGTLLLYLNSTYYILTQSETLTYTAVSAGEQSEAVTSLAAVSVNGTQYIFYAYTDVKSGSPYKPMLGKAMLSGGKVQPVWQTAISLTDDGIYNKDISLTDMAVTSAGELYVLLCDQYSSITYKGTNIYFNARGALIDAGSAETIASSDSAPSLSLTAYGWRKSSNGTYNYTYASQSIVCSLYAATSATYTDSLFTGPCRILAVTPKKITVADYGYYVDTTQKGYLRTRGTAIYSLEDHSFTIGAETTSGLYGENGSESIPIETTPESYY